jgi:hypothetical protein
LWKYLKAAFMFRIDVPAMGRMPVNIIGAAGFTILGFGHPAFWLLGLGLETAVLCSLAFNPRFQRYVASREVQVSREDAETQRQSLLQLLSPEAGAKLSALTDRCNQVLQVYQGTEAGKYLVEINRSALQRLQWLYLKLLVARHYLETIGKSDADSLQKKIGALEVEVKDKNASTTLIQSKTATLAILRQRLINFQNRSALLEEIDSDLTRIEAQVDLALENATIQGRPQAISTEIELASDLVSGTLFGEAQVTIAALEKTYAAVQPTRQRQVN